jgi:hypothetical protein
VVEPLVVEELFELGELWLLDELSVLELDEPVPR